MSQQNVEQFYEFIRNNQQLQDQLKASPNKESFLNTAVQLGQENNYTFTRQEADDFVSRKSQETAELSDAELESVAGGVAGGFTFCTGKSSCWLSVC